MLLGKYNKHNITIPLCLSQIGLVEGSGSSPGKTPISFEKICINIDANGGNVWLLDCFDVLHSKMQKREVVMSKVKDYLFE